MAPPTPVGAVGPGEDAGCSLDLAAAETRSWLAKRLGGRFLGLDKDDDGSWWVVLVLADGRTKSLGGSTPGAALEHARRWVSDQLEAAAARRTGP
jgi:hypothetical protein